MQRVILSFLIILVLVLAGCTTQTEIPSEEMETEEIVIELWTHEFPPLQEGLSNKWIPEFEESHPGIKVNLTAVPMVGVVAYDAKLLASLSAGGGPDVWDMTNYDYPVFLENGLVAPIDPTIFGYSSDQDLVDSFMPGTLNFLMKDGKIYGMFSEYNTLCLYYNLDVFEDAGIDPLPTDKPVSWERIAEIASEVRQTDATSGAPTRIGYQFGFFAAFRSPLWYAQMFYPILRQYGQEDVMVDGVAMANTEAVENALQLFYDFTHEYQAYDPNFLSNWFADFAQGRVSMVLAGTWFVPAILQQNPDVRFGVAPHPVVDPDDTDTYKNIQWSYGWAINPNKSKEQQEAAQEFLAFMLGKKGESEQALWWFSNMGYTQPSKAFFESTGYTEKLNSDPWLQPFVDAATMYELAYAPHGQDEIGSAMVRAIDRVVYDKMDPADSAEMWQGELERMQ